jgi:hypothetical protein
MGPLSEAERRAAIAASPLAGRYEAAVDRESAHELLAARAGKAAEAAAAAEAMLKEAEVREAELKRARRYEHSRPADRAGPSLGSELARAAVKQLNSRQGQALVRGILGTLFKSR